MLTITEDQQMFYKHYSFISLIEEAQVKRELCLLLKELKEMSERMTALYQPACL